MTLLNKQSIISFAIALFLLSLTVASVSSYADEVEDRKAIHALLETYKTVRKAADVDGISNLFHEDATIWAQNLTPLNGRENIHAFMTKALTVKPSDVSVDIDTLEIDGDLAFLSALTTMVVPGSDGAEPTTLRYRDLVVLQKRNGQWNVLQDIDQPLSGEAHYE